MSSQEAAPAASSAYAQHTIIIPRSMPQCKNKTQNLSDFLPALLFKIVLILD
ncbi:hypothetical protein [uncultured Ruminococcus sp.]|uniref:hypothetical protein n=1 Tax=uncultured Ruminococcus sp. TaxID=165186 RepID=UPI002626A664|nr:hypothetical protein [uncultured Ruminococcus sp.]